MRISVVKVALVISLIFNLSVVAAAGFVYLQKNSSWVSPFGIKLQKDRFLFEELSLRPEQVKAMRDKALPFRAVLEQKRKEISIHKVELLNLMRKEPLDRQALNNKLAEISKLQSEVEARVVEHILMVKSILEKEQQQKFIDLLQKAMLSGRAGCATGTANVQ